MANATDNLIMAENIIKGLMVGETVTDKAIEICRWLFSFNNIEKSFKIKCYQTNVPDARFCVDRGTDCETIKIRTVFLTIRPAFQLIFRLMDLNFPYLRNAQRDIYYIGSKDCQELPIETLKNHITESYCLKLEQLNLTSDICQGVIKPGAPSKYSKIVSQNVYLPTRMDFENASQMTGQKGQDILVDAILDQIEINCKKAGYYLKENWRLITERNIFDNWSKKRRN
jgi:hypothetical protein